MAVGHSLGHEAVQLQKALRHCSFHLYQHQIPHLALPVKLGDSQPQNAA